MDNISIESDYGKKYRLLLYALMGTLWQTMLNSIDRNVYFDKWILSVLYM
jgi:hypothetical protein